MAQPSQRTHCVKLTAPNKFLKARGFAQVRVRHHEDIARIEVPPEDLPQFFQDGTNEAVAQELKNIGYNYVTLDLQGYRTGSLNEALLGIEAGD